jgi:hypothetical protein
VPEALRQRRARCLGGGAVRVEAGQPARRALGLRQGGQQREFAADHLRRAPALVHPALGQCLPDLPPRGGEGTEAGHQWRDHAEASPHRARQEVERPR